ncbi:MAG: hypothetical protein CM15mP85_05290 [Rhodobacterales bacterium]|nr:MAG: hypothetical protein CM15mP85_05290 [Rhodobacterales bacterium]
MHLADPISHLELCVLAHFKQLFLNFSQLFKYTIRLETSVSKFSETKFLKSEIPFATITIEEANALALSTATCRDAKSEGSCATKLNDSKVPEVFAKLILA